MRKALFWRKRIGALPPSGPAMAEDKRRSGALCAADENDAPDQSFPVPWEWPELTRAKPAIDYSKRRAGQSERSIGSAI